MADACYRIYLFFAQEIPVGRGMKTKTGEEAPAGLRVLTERTSVSIAQCPWNPFEVLHQEPTKQKSQTRTTGHFSSMQIVHRNGCNHFPPRKLLSVRERKGLPRSGSTGERGFSLDAFLVFVSSYTGFHSAQTSTQAKTAYASYIM